MNHSEELWQEYRQNGRPIVGVGHPESEVDFTVLCGSAHVWIWRNVGGHKEVLLQKRASNKSLYPGYWDISAAGHVDLGEDHVEAAVREAKEEINLDIDDSRLDFIFSAKEFLDQQKYISLIAVFLYEASKDFNITPADGEVLGTKWVGIDELRRIVADGDNIVPHSKAYFAQLFEHLEAAK